VPLGSPASARTARRLQVSVVETRWSGGKVRHEHVASLGSVPHERLARLANRIDAAAQAKILAAVHARVPMVTVDEQRALQSFKLSAHGTTIRRAKAKHWPIVASSRLQYRLYQQVTSPSGRCKGRCALASGHAQQIVEIEILMKGGDK
jgi:hypothetical protein